MYAIVEIAGQQFKVSEGQELFVHRLEGNSGDKMEFKNIHLTHNDKDIKVGSAVKGTVNATILEHLKGEKVIVFKKKRRKGYQVKNGHRQYLTKIKIDSIL
jgi:large subunit ribosomal protein L21